jgi:hypothetical protein
MGRHCAALIGIEEHKVSVDLIDVAEQRYVEREVDCTDCESSAEVGERLSNSLDDLEPEKLHLRAVLTGEVGKDCEVDQGELASLHGNRYAELKLVDGTRPAYDFEALAREPTAAGRFVSDLSTRIESASDTRERAVLEIALLAGMRALEGRRSLIHVD